MTDYGSICYPGSPTDQKDPNAIESFVFNWVVELDGDTISTSDFLLPDGLTEGTSSNDDTTATVFLSGGTEGQIYRVTNRIVTVGLRTLDKTKRILVTEQ